MTFLSVYKVLFKHYGPQQWWPGDTPFEIMTGAILTQNTAWTNVEKAITNLLQAQSLNADVMATMESDVLAGLIRPAGYFNIKARRLQNFCHWLLEQGGEQVVKRWSDLKLRHGLLSVNGVGPETADDMLLYAFNRPVFVIDAYTRRIFQRLGLIDANAGYETLRQQFEHELSRKVKQRDKLRIVFNEYHALIVRLAKEVCRKTPRCGECCLRRQCPSAEYPG